MKNKNKALASLSLVFFILFGLWTLLLRFVDVRAIGPMDSEVGFATLNRAVHGLLGVNMGLYTVTDWLGLVPVCVALFFAGLGLFQWIKRKSILKVDRSLLFLGSFYALVAAVYLFFEAVPWNYRPILIDGFLEASYPSSTTLLALTVMPTAAMQCEARLKAPALRRAAVLLSFAFSLFMAVARLLSGVHWVTDIIGGVLISAALVLAYAAAAYGKA